MTLFGRRDLVPSRGAIGGFAGVRRREKLMSGQNQGGFRANETIARLVAFVGPYILWGTLGVVVWGMLLTA